MSFTNCPNCGAVVDPHAEACAYCDTPYDPWGLKIRHPAELGRPKPITDIMTPNELRALLGYPPPPPDLVAIVKEVKK